MKKIILCLFLLLPTISWAEQRVALVIGNSDYKKITPLRNPSNDAKDMAIALRSLDFEVTEKINLNRQQMAKAIYQFGKKLGKGVTGLFYYAGHGVQVEGRNYLIPLNAVIKDKDEVRYESINVERILHKMKSAGNLTNIIILDACRNNPFKGRGGFRDMSLGLARVDAPTGSLIVYATGPGEKAADGKGKNGLFTKHLLKNISRPNLDIALMLRDTRLGVMKDSIRLGYQEQIPWESSSLLAPFCFAGCIEDTKSLDLAQSEKQKSQVFVFEPEMTTIPVGSFQMGCVSRQSCNHDEKLVHTVEINTFALAKTETTFKQWNACVKEGGCSHKPKDEGWGRNQYPVINVNWNDAQEYVKWLSYKTGKHYRLPTEAEWEYAARAGTATKYSWGSHTPACNKTAKNGASHDGGEDSACYYNPKNQQRGTEKVGSYSANAWGLYDMHGNAREWVQDCYHQTYENAPSNSSEWQENCYKSRDGSTSAILRGGSWFDIPDRLRSAFRNNYSRVYRDNVNGFRVARTN
jgi:formylglycine-generating enzyme required for sulfatase activity